jgi:hypothetical protein
MAVLFLGSMTRMMLIPCCTAPQPVHCCEQATRVQILEQECSNEQDKMRMMMRTFSISR